MKSIEDQLSTYATYHRDRRNVATHFFGIPMIVVGTEGLLGRPSFDVGSVPLSPALVVTALVALYYFALDRRFGLAMAAFLGVSLWLGVLLAGAGTAAWLTGALGLLVVGWIFQFVGHWFEGKKPAFVDDISGFVIGPLFVVAEAGFALGFRTELRDTMQDGPLTPSRPHARAAAPLAPSARG